MSPTSHFRILQNISMVWGLTLSFRFSPHTIEMFCKILKCGVGDIMRHIPDGKA